MKKKQKTIPHPLKEYCEAKGMSLYSFAKQSGLSLQGVKYITDWRSFPRINTTLVTLLDATNGEIEAAWFLLPQEYEKYRSRRIANGEELFTCSYEG